MCLRVASNDGMDPGGDTGIAGLRMDFNGRSEVLG